MSKTIIDEKSISETKNKNIWKTIEKVSVMMPNHIPKVILQFWEKVSILRSWPYMMSMDPICMPWRNGRCILVGEDIWICNMSSCWSRNMDFRHVFLLEKNMCGCVRCLPARKEYMATDGVSLLEKKIWLWKMILYMEKLIENFSLSPFGWKVAENFSLPTIGLHASTSYMIWYDMIGYDRIWYDIRRHDIDM